MNGWPSSKTYFERKENNGAAAALRRHHTRTLAGLEPINEDLND
jgi:hypothetical protein